MKNPIVKIILVIVLIIVGKKLYDRYFKNRY